MTVCTLTRPQGTDHLTLTWKVDEDILHHIDIQEQGKPNQFSLGKSLWIGSDVSITAFGRVTRFAGVKRDYFL